MGHPKGKPNRYHSKTFKLEQVRKVLSGVGTRAVAKEAGIGDRLLRQWVNIYTTIGERGLEDKKRPGNPLAKYARRKELTEIEQLTIRTC